MSFSAAYKGRGRYQPRPLYATQWSWEEGKLH